MKRIFLLLVLLVLLSSAVFSAPLPRGIALNNETKECAGFWGGDEFTKLVLPEGWQAYYPNAFVKRNYSNKFKIETPAGSCNISEMDEKKCCRQLNYTFVSENIGKPPEAKIISCLLFHSLLVLGAVALLILKKKTKSFIPVKSYYMKGLIIGVFAGLLVVLMMNCA